MLTAVVKLSSNGRLLIPAKMREQMGIESGDELSLSLTEKGLYLRPRKEAVKAAQEIVAQYVPAHVNLSEELIHERRLEGKND